jgi:hypothetical protein
VPDDAPLDWPVRLRDDEVAGSKPATPTWPEIGAPRSGHTACLGLGGTVFVALPFQVVAWLHQRAR